MRTFSERRTGRTTKRPPCLGCDDDRRVGATHGAGHRMLELQQSVGNGAVVAMLSNAQRFPDDEEYEEAPSAGESAQAPEAQADDYAQDVPDAGGSAEVEPTEQVDQSVEVDDSDANPEASSAEPEAAEPEPETAEPETAEPESAEAETEPLPSGPFEGEETEVEVEGKAFSFKGKTTAAYAHSWDHANDAVNGTVRTGDMIETFSVSTNVTLPALPKGLSECEAPIVDDAINVQLANHEQAHVDAFHNNYDGTVSTPFSETGSAAQVTAKLAARHAANKAARQAAADAASKALDPFQVDVDTTSCDKTSTNETAPASDDAQNA